MNAKILSAVFTQYNKAIQCGKFDNLRVNRALGILQHGEPRPYATTMTGCTCPDFAKRGKPCKHIISRMLAYRAFETLLQNAQSVIIGDVVIIDGEIFPIDTVTAHKLTEKANLIPRLVMGGIAYRKG